MLWFAAPRVELLYGCRNLRLARSQKTTKAALSELNEMDCDDKDASCSEQWIDDGAQPDMAVVQAFIGEQPRVVCSTMHRTCSRPESVGWPIGQMIAQLGALVSQ